MIELTQTDAEQIRFDIWKMNDLKDHTESTERNRPGKYNNAHIEKEIATLDERIRRMTHISPDQPISDIYDMVYHAVNAASSMQARHITVADLPNIRKDTRNGYPNHYKKATKPPGKINPKTRAKRAAALVRTMRDGTWDNIKREWIYPGDDSITHIATGRVWNAYTGATAKEFLKFLRMDDMQDGVSIERLSGATIKEASK